MATADDVITTYGTTGRREDLSDTIYSISPTETPAMMMFGRGNATQIYHEWQTDGLVAAVANNHVPEGEEANFVAVASTTRVGNHCQISQKTAVVSGTNEAVSKAGRRRELAYQLQKRAKELKRDMESNILNNASSVAGAHAAPATGTARVSAGLPAWLTTNTNRGATGADKGFDEGGSGAVVVTLATDGTQRAFLESDLKDTIAQCWDSGGDPSVIMVGHFNKRVASGFTGNSTRFDRGEDKRLVAAVDYYVSDFGTHQIVPNRFSRARDALVITPRMASVDYLRGFRQSAIAKTGDSEKRQLLVEYTLRVSNEAAHGVVADLTTS